MRALAARVATLRARLLIGTVVLLVLGLAVSDVVVLTSLRKHMLARVDKQLIFFAKAASTLPLTLPAGAQPTPIPPQSARALLGTLDLIDSFTLTYLRPDGAPLASLTVPLIAGGPRLPRLDTAAARRLDGVPFSTGDTAGARHGWRVVVLTYHAYPSNRPLTATGPRPPEGSVVIAAASESGVSATTSALGSACGLTGAAVVVLLGLAGWFLVDAQLRPLRRIEDTATAIAGGDLGRRVPAGRPGTEVGRLTEALNGMLGQLEEAFAARARANQRLREFVADVSHELRTPLFTIHGSTQLYRMGGLAGPAELDATMRRIENESARLGRLATDLLMLARMEAQAAEQAGAALDLAPMDLRTLAADARIDVRALDPARELTVTGPDGGEPGGAPVLGDEARLRQVTTNLVGNAVIHTPAGSPLRIGVGREGGAAVWEIEDHGAGLTPEQAERIFDPFYRLDTSRSRSRGAGAGLGLAIVRALVTAHQGRVVVRSTPGEGTTMRVELPLHEPAP